MIFRRGLHSVLASAAFSLSLGLPSPLWSQPILQVVGGTEDEAIISVDGEVTHRDAQFHYPDQIGDMPLRKIIIYNDGDVSGEYTLQGGGNGDAWVSLFVFPANNTLEVEAKGAEDSLVDNMSATKIQPPAPAPPGVRNGRSGWYRGSLNGMQLTTGYMLVQHGKWLMKARFSIPDAGGETSIARTVRALSDVPWEWVPDKNIETDKEVAQG